MPRLALSILCIVFAAGCQLPARDNAYDRNNLPEPTLRLLAADPAGADCPTTPPEAFVVGNAFPRSWCIFLDATESEGASDFEFFLAGPGEEPQLLEANQTGIYLLPQATRFSLVVGAGYTVRVRVLNSGNGSLERIEPLVVSTEAPVARTAPPITLPAGGVPWDPGTAYSVPFRDGGSSDPEGDPLSYCWRFEGPGEAPGSPEICSSDPEDPLFTRTLPVSLGLTRGILRVTDGARFSAPATLEVHVGVPLWAGSASSSGTAYFLDGERQIMRPRVAGNRTPRWAQPFVVPGASPRIALLERRVLSDEEWIVILNPQTGAVEGELAVGTSFSSAWIAADPPNARIWVVRDDFVNDQWLVSHFTVSETSPAAATLVGEGGTVTVPYTLEGSDDILPNVSVDDTGALWFTPPFQNFVARVDETDALDVLPLTDRRVGGIASRPGTSETWVVDSPDFMNGVTGLARVTRFMSASDQAGTSWDLPGQWGTSIAWISADEFWICDSAAGASLVDAALLDAGVTFDEAVVARAPSLVATFYLFADTRTGGAFTVDIFAGAGWKVARDGSTTPFVPDEIPMLQEPVGSYWHFSSNGDVLRKRESDANGVIHRGSLFLSGQPSPALATGRLWTYSNFPPALIEIAEDGTPLQVIETVTASGVPGPLDSVRQIRYAQDGTWMVARKSGTPGLAWIDLQTDPPVISNLAEPPGGFLISARPSSPTAASPFIWALTSEGVVAQLPLSPAAWPAAALTFAERAQGPNVVATMAPSLEDSSLCLLTVQDDADPTVGPSTIRVRRISAAGVVSTLLTTTTPTPSTFLEIGIASAGAGSEAVCWAVLSDTQNPRTDVRGLMPNGATVHTVFSDATRMSTSFAALSAETFWRTSVDATSGDLRVIRTDWNGSAWIETPFGFLDETFALSSANSTRINGGSDEFTP